MRIDHNEDDGLIAAFIAVAEEYIKNAIGDVDTESQLYKLVQTMLVSHWYDTREIARIGNNSYDIPHAFNAMITQLKYCKEGDEE